MLHWEQGSPTLARNSCVKASKQMNEWKGSMAFCMYGVYSSESSAGIRPVVGLDETNDQQQQQYQKEVDAFQKDAVCSCYYVHRTLWRSSSTVLPHRTAHHHRGGSLPIVSSATKTVSNTTINVTTKLQKTGLAKLCDT
jgi:hypothetical protein